MKKNKDKKTKTGAVSLREKIKALPAYLWSIAGAATVLIVIAALVLPSWLGAFRPRSTGEHSLANVLPETVNYLPYFKDGSMFYYKDGASEEIAPNVYSGASEELLYDSNYALDVDSGKLIYMEADSDSVLKFYDGTALRTLGKGILSWRTVRGMNAIAYTTEEANSDLGLLFLYTGEKILTLGTDMLPSSIRFSQDGQYLFALRPNTYPQTNYTLYRYALDGTSDILVKNCKEVIWISQDGSRFATGISADETVYDYTLYTDYGKKSLDVPSVYLPAVSGDQSVIYLLADYDATAESGTLLAVDTRTLKTKELATGVNFFNAAAVTDGSKGMVYSIKVSEDDDIPLFDLYYTSLQGETIRLVKNAYESTLYTIALNTEKQRGYLLVHGSTMDRNALYEVSWKKDQLTSRTVDTGTIDGLVYFEKPDQITYIKNPSENLAALYGLSYGGQPLLLAEDCSVTYDEYSGTFSSQSLLSNDGKRVMYFSDFEATDETETVTFGTLHIYDTVTGTRAKIGENVSSAYGSMPTVDGSLSLIYYLQKQEDLFDLYCYDGKESIPVDTGVLGSLTMATD